MSLNKVTLIGRLGADPEVKDTRDGKPFAKLSLATTEKWKDRGGQRQEKTEWHRITIWNEGLVGVAEQYLRKGSQVYIEGKLQTSKYQKNGEDRYSTEIVLQGFDAKLVMLDSRRGGSGGGDTDSGDDFGSSSGARPQRSGGGGGGHRRSDMDDEIPFAPEVR